MTDSEFIIKGLECHEDENNSCDDCPYRACGCSLVLCGDALDLINRQQAEIENITEKFNCQQTVYADLSKIIKDKNAEIERLNEEKAKFDNTILYDLEQVNKIAEKSKSEAVKEFEYKLLDVSHLRIPQKIYPDDIRKVKKEMVGEDK